MISNPSHISVRLVDPTGHLTGPLTVPTVTMSETSWRSLLSEEQYRITRTHGTERAFCGVFHDNHKAGIYACVGCGLPNFRSDAKFDSGTGWPSFFQPVASENIASTRDLNYGMIRTEIHCSRCGSHLGHVFEDGPAPTGLRYCINSDSLKFHENINPTHEKVLLGAGCFWGVEATFGKVRGVCATRAGYAGGHVKNPSYEDVCSHTTGHAEVVEVEFDPAMISFEALLDVFWGSHDPSAPQQTGPDNGGQYRSAIFFTTPGQEAIARLSAANLEKNGRIISPVTTEISLAHRFYAAEDYHQKYYEKTSCRVP